MINIGQYIEELINWMMIHFSAFFDALNLGIGSFINGFQHILFGIPWYCHLPVSPLSWGCPSGCGRQTVTVRRK